jgi:hypothetical protein
MNSSENRRFPLLKISDLELHPVWETILNDETDDQADAPSVFPVQPLPVNHLAARFVATRVRLANGELLWAMLFNIDVNDARKTEQFLQLRLALNGQWFWLARYWDVDYEKSGPQALAHFLGLPIDEIFPVSYDIRQYSAGDRNVLEGKVTREPRKRLPDDVITRMAIG